MVIYIYHFLLFKRSLPRVDVEQTSLKGKVEEMIKITKRFLKECSVLDGESPDFSLWAPLRLVFEHLRNASEHNARKLHSPCGL